jgi:hypothetical protein
MPANYNDERLLLLHISTLTSEAEMYINENSFITIHDHRVRRRRCQRGRSYIKCRKKVVEQKFSINLRGKFIRHGSLSHQTIVIAGVEFLQAHTNTGV